jgi:hypothetical protein
MSRSSQQADQLDPGESMFAPSGALSRAVLYTFALGLWVGWSASDLLPELAAELPGAAVGRWSFHVSFYAVLLVVALRHILFRSTSELSNYVEKFGPFAASAYASALGGALGLLAGSQSYGVLELGQSPQFNLYVFGIACFFLSTPLFAFAMVGATERAGQRRRLFLPPQSAAVVKALGWCLLCCVIFGFVIDTAKML